MKNSSMTLISLLALSGTVFGQTASSFVAASSSERGTHQFTQSGAPADLKLCSFELCHLDANGVMKIEPVASGSMSAIISQASEPDADKYLVFYPVGQERNPNARRVLRNHYVVTLTDGADLEAVKKRCGMKSIRLVREGSNLAVCEENSAGRVLGQLSNVLNDPEISAAEPVFAKKRFKRAIPTDPFYASNEEVEVNGNYQWYLNNEGINGGVADIDINLEGALDFATGVGVTVAIVDDGIATDHLDLVDNATGPHLNLLGGAGDDPNTLDATANHGTGIAALIGAAFNNDEGISGVAPEATLSGIRLLSGAAENAGLLDDVDEAAALSFSNDAIDIYSNSWGPDDTTLALEGPGALTIAALRDGVENGRDGDGVIYVWAAGNGGEIGDRSDYDGYANSKYTIAVGSVDDSGRQASYSEEGSNLVVVAPSDGGAQSVLTAAFGVGTDDDDNPIRTSLYDTAFGGSSVSAGLVSGVTALMLEENPNLNWREVQDILMRSAVMVDPSDGDWIVNAAGINFNHKYGAGLVDAAEAVRMATNPSLSLGELETHSLNLFFASNSDDPSNPSGIIPDNDGDSLLVGFDMSQDEFGNALPNLRVEHVEFVATIISETLTESRSNLEIVLISPNGTQSTLHTADAQITEQSIFRFPFMSVRNWGEGSAGTWIVRITDVVSGDVAFLNNASLVVHGSIDPDAPVTPQPLLTSAPLISISQGVDFTYSLETAGATTVTLGDLPDGVVFDPATSLIFGAATTPGLFEVPLVLTDQFGVEGNFIINFVVAPTAVALGDAIGFSGIPAVFEGDEAWDFEFSDTNDDNNDTPDGSSARSAIGLADGESSIFGFDGLEQGVLMFDWRTSSQEGADRLWFNRGGDVPSTWDAFISGERPWATTAVILPGSSNDVRWLYTKDGADSEGEDRGLVDNVRLISMDKYLSDLIAAGPLEGFIPEFDSRTIFYPRSVSGASPAPGGVDPLALASPSIGNGQTASISTWVEGPGDFSFTTLLYSSSSDFFEVLIDGAVQMAQPGNVVNGTMFTFDEVVFIQDSVEIPAGRHRVEVRFRKGFTETIFGVLQAGPQANGTLPELPFEGILLDDVTFTPEGSTAAPLANALTDTDGDGYNDFLESAFGGDLDSADIPTYLPKVVSSGGSKFIEFGIDTSLSNLNLIPQQSEDLVQWANAEGANLVRTVGDVEVYQIPVTSEGGSPSLFFRVRAEVK